MKVYLNQISSNTIEIIKIKNKLEDLITYDSN